MCKNIYIYLWPLSNNMFTFSINLYYFGNNSISNINSMWQLLLTFGRLSLIQYFLLQYLNQLSFLLQNYGQQFFKQYTSTSFAFKMAVFLLIYVQNMNNISFHIWIKYTMYNFLCIPSISYLKINWKNWKTSKCFMNTKNLTTNTIKLEHSMCSI